MNAASDSGVSIHAGFPNPAADQSLSSLSLDQLLIDHPSSTYLFRIRGGEWQAQGIFDGDIAIVDRAVEAHKSDLVIWWHEAETNFVISKRSHVKVTSSLWGTITAIIHSYHPIGNIK